MAGITLQAAQAQLDLWLAADAAVASGQSYSIKDRSLSRTDAAEITQKIEYWNAWVQKLSRAARGRGRTRYVVTG
jgi:hypothetical protein